LKNYFKIPRVDGKTGAPQQVYEADEIVELEFMAIILIDITKTKSN
jgi:Ca2+-binding EF-hand superfamily protein